MMTESCGTVWIVLVLLTMMSLVASAETTRSDHEVPDAGGAPSAGSASPGVATHTETESRPQIELPPCGMFVGAGVYPMAGGYYLSGLLGHPYWTTETNTPQQMIRRVLDDNQGNMIQLWGYPRGYAPAMLANWFYALDEIGIDVPDPDWETGEHLRPQDSELLRSHADREGAGIVRFVNEAADQGLYTLCLYTDAKPQWSAKLHDAGRYYLGYDFGERFTFGLDNPALKDRPLEDITLHDFVDDLVQRVRKHIDARRAAGWGPIYATSSNFHVDYEIIAGADVPLIEDFAFRHLNLASALSRGLYRQFELPLWGSHLAHEHYSWLPYEAKHKFDLLRVGMQLKYMAGCKMIINESGNWFVEASLVEDSPKFDLPVVPLQPSEVDWSGGKPLKFIPYREDAKKHFDEIGYDAEPSRRYRKVVSDFYDFVKENGTPRGQPETTVAIVKGNLDLAYHTFSPNNALAGAYKLANADPRWYEGAPERGWEIVKEVFFPLHDVLGPYPNHFLSGTPYGQIDVVTFADPKIDAEFLSQHYKALLFAGWNTATDRQYEVLTQYARQGGTLFIAIPQLSTNADRNYTDYPVESLVHGGDLSALCGVKVKGPGRRFYWATAKPGVDDLGFSFPRRFGIMTTRLGDIEITDPKAEVLVVDDELGQPLLIRRPLGEGTVYFLNSWDYPGALNRDEGPGARLGSKGLIGTIYQHIASNARGSVWISNEQDQVDASCEYVAYAYFPESGEVCLQNVDLDHPRRVKLHRPDTDEIIDLSPAEFRIIKADGRVIRVLSDASEP